MAVPQNVQQPAGILPRNKTPLCVCTRGHILSFIRSFKALGLTPHLSEPEAGTGCSLQRRNTQTSGGLERAHLIASSTGGNLLSFTPSEVVFPLLCSEQPALVANSPAERRGVGLADLEMSLPTLTIPRCSDHCVQCSSPKSMMLKLYPACLRQRP